MAEFTDAQIVQVLKKAGRSINRELNLFGTSDEISIDNVGNITPDDDEALYDLVRLQAECMLTSAEFQSELRSGDAGTLVRDGEQTVDTRDIGDIRSKFFDSPNSPCNELKVALRNEKLRRLNTYNVW